MLTHKTTKMNENIITSRESEDDVVFVKEEATYNSTCYLFNSK